MVSGSLETCENIIQGKAKLLCTYAVLETDDMLSLCSEDEGVNNLIERFNRSCKLKVTCAECFSCNIKYLLYSLGNNSKLFSCFRGE